MSADSTAHSASSAAPSSSAGFTRTATAIFATMVLLIVALTGILVETTWRDPARAVDVASPDDPGSVARR